MVNNSKQEGYKGPEVLTKWTKTLLFNMEGRIEV